MENKEIIKRLKHGIDNTKKLLAVEQGQNFLLFAVVQAQTLLAWLEFWLLSLFQYLLADLEALVHALLSPECAGSGQTRGRLSTASFRPGVRSEQRP